MGCPAGACTGYELLNDIDASTNTNWQPIGTVSDGFASFASIFDGNGFEIENLKINRPRSDFIVGLFAEVASTATIKNVGLVNVSVKGNQSVGALAGQNNGTIENSYISSGSISGTSNIGGLAGNNAGTIKESSATASVSSEGERVGVLVGFNNGAIENSYAMGSVSGSDQVGGLVGATQGSIKKSFSTAHVTATFLAAGLAGGQDVRGTNYSYWDVNTSDQDTSSGGGRRKITAELKSGRPSTSIFSNWDTAIWDFGTSSDYPQLVNDNLLNGECGVGIGQCNAGTSNNPREISNGNTVWACNGINGGNRSPTCFAPTYASETLVIQIEDEKQVARKITFPHTFTGIHTFVGRVCVYRGVADNIRDTQYVGGFRRQPDASPGKFRIDSINNVPNGQVIHFSFRGGGDEPGQLSKTGCAGDTMTAFHLVEGTFSNR